MTSVEVIAPGPLTTIQDLGRPGWAHIGVPRSGAVDRPALILANTLVGNDEGAAALETTLVGPRLRADGPALVALTGAAVQATVDGAAVPMREAFPLAAGVVLDIGPARRGLRTYIAFAGGIGAPLTLGSAATDVLTGLGPKPLARGDVLTLARPQVESDVVTPARPRVESDVVTLARPRVEKHNISLCFSTRGARGGAGDEARGRPGLDPERPLRIVVGPREDRFSPEAIRALTTQPYTVTPASNRIGLRLDGPALQQLASGELRSEGIVPGAIQVPPDGQPILLLADHPTTGGYPVIAVLKDEDLAAAGQLRPGRQVSFEVVTPAGGPPLNR